MKQAHTHLSRRERQIMDVLYKKGRATVAEVMEAIPDPPGYSAVRATMATLEAKGHIRHEKEGAKFVFVAAVPASRARRWAVQHLVQTFFAGSREDAVAALLDVTPAQFSEGELDRMAGLIEAARKEERRKKR